MCTPHCWQGRLHQPRTNRHFPFQGHHVSVRVSDDSTFLALCLFHRFQSGFRLFLLPRLTSCVSGVYFLACAGRILLGATPGNVLGVHPISVCNKGNRLLLINLKTEYTCMGRFGLYRQIPQWLVWNYRISAIYANIGYK